MADFFNDPNGQQNDTPVVDKVKVGEKEYTQEDLAELVKMGEFGREVEAKSNTKLDKVYPSFTKATQELKELREKFEAQEQLSKQPEVNLDDEAAIREARAAAKKVGLITNDDIGEYVRKEFPNYYREQRESEKILESAKNLETKYNGSDGRPKFETEDMLGFMRDSGISNAETAYKVRYEDELDKWKDVQLSKSRKPDIYTNNGISVPKMPTTKKITKDNLLESIREELYSNAE